MKSQKSKVKSQKLFMILFLGILFLPLICWAGEYQANGKTIHYEGLVPCGKSEAGPDESDEVTMACQFCHFFVMLKGIIDFFLLPPTGVVFIIGVLMLVIAGSMFIYGNLIAPGNPKLVADAQRVMTSVIVGLIIVFGAWLFINAFFLMIGVAEWTGLKGGWFTIECPIELPEAYAPGSSFALSSPGGDKFSVPKGDEFNLDLGFNPVQPVSNMDMVLNFDPNLLSLISIKPNPDASNFKTFLPLKDDGGFDEERVVETANATGLINMGATCFDGENLTDPQNSPVDSLVILVFEAKEIGTTEIVLDPTNSNLMAAIGDIIDILGEQENKIEVTITE